MPVKPCSEIMKNETAFSPYKPYQDTKYFKQLASNYGMCIESHEKESYISGGGGDTSFDVLVLHVSPCILGDQCMPIEYIRETGLLVSMPSTSQNLSNYDEPVLKYLNSEAYYFVNENNL